MDFANPLLRQLLRLSIAVWLCFAVLSFAALSLPGRALAEPGGALALTGHTRNSSLTNLCLIKGLSNQRKSSRQPFQGLVKHVVRADASREEKFLQLLLTSVGSVGIFVAILALRSIPPARKSD